jgi:hypothetical protein
LRPRRLLILGVRRSTKGVRRVDSGSGSIASTMTAPASSSIVSSVSRSVPTRRATIAASRRLLGHQFLTSILVVLCHASATELHSEGVTHSQTQHIDESARSWARRKVPPESSSHWVAAPWLRSLYSFAGCREVKTREKRRGKLWLNFANRARMAWRAAASWYT